LINHKAEPYAAGLLLQFVTGFKVDELPVLQVFKKDIKPVLLQLQFEIARPFLSYLSFLLAGSRVPKMAKPNTQTTYSSGIYHGLPTFPQVGQTAIVTGANGISGQAMLSVLLGHPERWTSIYALSQGPQLSGGATAPYVKHVAANFLSGKERIAEIFKESSDAEVMVKENGDMLEDFIHALFLAEAPFKRIVLQTGGKVNLVPNFVIYMKLMMFHTALWRSSRSLQYPG
jgi:hypothetical protein